MKAKAMIWTVLGLTVYSAIAAVVIFPFAWVLGLAIGQSTWRTWLFGFAVWMVVPCCIFRNVLYRTERLLELERLRG